ncbi:MAG: hypothetical protein J2P48_15430 [Alphaproteobacteria bacterium]|nr:hypothetical protein [Alphaproteobacteria bacterium]
MRDRAGCAFFFYTLMDRSVLPETLGRRVWPSELRPRDRVDIGGAADPVVIPQCVASLRGVILATVTAAERDRLCAYEGTEYELARVLARQPNRRCTPVFFFKPKPGIFSISSRGWTFAEWRLHHKLFEMRSFAAAPGAPAARRI